MASKRTRGVTFINMNGESFHTYKDWGLHLSSISVPNPEPKLTFVEIPGSSEVIDLSDMYGEPTYNQRTVTFVFQVKNGTSERYSKTSTIAEQLHGNKLKMILDDSTDWFFLGRVNFNEWVLDLPLGTLTFTCTCNPYKYSIKTTADPWEWDTFSFEDGIIEDASNWVINGTATHTIWGTNKIIYPEIYCSAPMVVSLDGGTSVRFSAGTTKAYDLPIPRGEKEHTLKITGQGEICITFRRVTF